MINSVLREENPGFRGFFEVQNRFLQLTIECLHSMINSVLREENPGFENFSLEKF